MRKIVLLDYANRGKRRRAGDGISAKRRERQSGILVRDLGYRGRAADRRPVSHTLREGHHLGLHVPVLDAAPVVSRAPPTGLHLVADKDSAVAPDYLRNDFEIVLRRSDESAHSHYRFRDERGNVTGCRGLNKFLDVSRALHRATVWCQIERTAIAIWRVGMNDSRHHRRPVLPRRI